MSAVGAEVITPDGVSVTAGATPVELPGRPGRRGHPAAVDAGVDAAVAVLCGAVLAPVLGVSVVVAATSLLGWCAVRLTRGGGGLRRADQWADRLAPLTVTVSVAALAVVFAGLPPETVREVTLCLGSVTLVVLAVGAVRARWVRPVRTIVLDQPCDVAPDAVGAAHGQPDWWPSTGKGAPAIVGVGTIERDGTVPTVVATTGEELGLEQAVGSWGVDLVALAPDTHLTPADLRTLTWRLEPFGTHVALLSAAPVTAAHRTDLRGWSGRPVLQLAPPRPSVRVRILKQVIDRCAGLLLLLIALPVLAGLAIAVRCESRGPAIFAQTRVGRDGRPFRMYKLRTMHAGAEGLRPLLATANDADGPLFKIQDDPRVTRLGRVLRRTSLDELPQLVNVVRGEMSLVGPRPALPDEVTHYDQRTRRRLAVRPGLTGLWQVSGRSDLDWDRSVELDLHYTDNISIAGDLAICVRTVRAILGGKGAY